MKWPRIHNPFRITVQHSIFLTAQGSFVFIKQPFVTRFSLHLLERGMSPGTMGYRHVGADRRSFTAVWARPFVVWLACWLGWRIKQGFGGFAEKILCWLFIEGFLGYVEGRDHEAFCWRRIRLGARFSCKRGRKS